MVLCLPLSHEGSPLNTLFSFQPYHRKNSSFEMIVTRLPQLLLESMKYSGGKKKKTLKKDKEGHILSGEEGGGLSTLWELKKKE